MVYGCRVSFTEIYPPMTVGTKGESSEFPKMENANKKRAHHITHFLFVAWLDSATKEASELFMQDKRTL